MSTETKVKCPYCAEWIQPEAILCRFCGRSVTPSKTTSSSTSVTGSAATRSPSNTSEESLDTQAIINNALRTSGKGKTAATFQASGFQKVVFLSIAACLALVMLNAIVGAIRQRLFPDTVASASLDRSREASTDLRATPLSDDGAATSPADVPTEVPPTAIPVQPVEGPGGFVTNSVQLRQGVRVVDVTVGAVEYILNSRLDDQSMVKKPADGQHYIEVVLSILCEAPQTTYCTVSAADTALVDADGVVYEPQPVLELQRDLKPTNVQSGRWLERRSVFFIVPDTVARPFLRYRRGTETRYEAFIDLSHLFVPTTAPPTATVEAVAEAKPTATTNSEPEDVETVLKQICGDRFKWADPFDDPNLPSMVRCAMPEASFPDQQLTLAAFDFVNLTQAVYQRYPSLRYLVVQFTTNSGRAVELPIVTINISRGLYKSINWKTMDPVQITQKVANSRGRYDADDGVAVTPAYEDAWQSFMNQ